MTSKIAPSLSTASKLKDLTSSSPTRLSRTVLLYSPSKARGEEDLKSPKLVVIASWMGADDTDIAQYINGYQKMYPALWILLVKSPFRWYYCSPRTCRRDIAPAAEVIRNICSYSVDDTPQMIIHIFSNGGSCTVYTLYDLYWELMALCLPLANKNDALLPPHLTIYDSAPGGWTYTGSTTAILSSLSTRWRRVLLFPFVHLLGLWCTFKYKILEVREEGALWSSAHNDTVLVREIGRSYIYSEADRVTDYRDVERHAKQAKAKGFTVLHRQKHIDSGHVAHVKKYPFAYWKAVKESWELGLRRAKALQTQTSEDINASA